MLRIALRSLFHDRSRFLAALAGVTFAGLLATVESAIYEGFLYTTSNVITRMGGDVWVTARGVRVFDNVEPISGGTRSIVTEHPCVERARPLVFTFSWIRTAHGSRETVRVVGTDGEAPYLPWSLVQGLPSDLEAPMRVAVDTLDLRRLGIADAPIGRELAIMNQRAHVAAVSEGARSFTLLPFIFTRIDDARRLTPLTGDQLNAWVLDLADPSCTAEVVRTIDEHPELKAWSAEGLRDSTQTFWLESSGAGAILAFSALMGLLVGGVIVGQTLYSTVRDHEAELATLRAIGCAPWEVAAFVGWQVTVLTGLGFLLGGGAAALLGLVSQRGGLEMIFSAGVWVKSGLVLVFMAAAASVVALRRLLRIDPAGVFR